MQNTILEIEAAGSESDLYVIPFELGSEIVLKSTKNPALKEKTTVYGAVPGRMIIVEEPLFSLNERFAGLSEGFACAYLHGNHLLKFESKFNKRLFANVIGIDYPKKVKRIRIRSTTRIPINIETQVFLGAKDGTVSAIMVDISEGGCCLELPGLIETELGSKFCLTFMLPDNQNIDNLACTLRNTRHFQEKKATQVGVSFSGPGQALMKVKNFCKLCAFYTERF
ncbi:MAG TPA: PilZ domain-containing protein [Syntrophobacteraceae bacterium]|nr:PilZ domain-containing protein [Syntrophobacteraceae bacterium]